MQLVLVHGAWFAGWTWSRVADDLRARGHSVHVVEQLPSGADDPAARGDLAADVAHVRSVLDGVDSDDGVVLVGHSYGGIVIGELAAHPRVRHSVFVAAFRPSAGKSLLDVRSPHPIEWIEAREDGSLHVTDDHAVARDVLVADLDETVFADVHDRRNGHAAITFAQPATAPAPAHPVTYVLCERDRAIFPADQERMATGADHVVRLDATHMAPLTHPAELAGVLASVR